MVGALIICGILLWIFTGPFQRISESLPKQKVERSYLVRRKSDNYPLTVNDDQLEKALATGDYTLDPNFEDGGFIYNNTYVPPGYRIADGQQKQDQRLN